MNHVFIYNFSAFEENRCQGIHIFGLNEANESVYILVSDFRPYVYLELPNEIEWTSGRISILGAKLDELCGNTTHGCRPVKKEYVEKHKLYFAKYNPAGPTGAPAPAMYPFLKCSFNCHSQIRFFRYKLTNNVFVPSIGPVRLLVHEDDADPIIQFRCEQHLPAANWVSFPGAQVSDAERRSLCKHEFHVSYRKIRPHPHRTSIVRPLMMSIDIEVNSSNPNKVPTAIEPEDKIFQISAVLCRQGDPDERYDKYLLTLARNRKGDVVETDHEALGHDVELLMFNSEGALLQGLRDLILERDPQIIMGYNIFRFDLPYIYDRAKLTFTISDVDQMSCLIGHHSRMTPIRWSSKAFGKQDYQYLDTIGRLWIDFFIIANNEYQFGDYKLKTVADNLIGQTKDPLTHKGIFKCYRMFTPKSLALVGKYCVQDSYLVLKMFEKTQKWIDFVESSNVNNTPIFVMYTQGQQIKMFYQMYALCLEKNTVIDKSSYLQVDEEDGKYQGAYVFDPVPGLYDMVTSFDFTSLYPSAIIAFNIDYSTLVLDPAIPDDQCHLFEWEDHVLCEHAGNQRRTKPKKDQIICGKKNSYRFLKEPQGFVPALLEHLLAARKKCKNQMKELQDRIHSGGVDEKELPDLEKQLIVLDKRQLAFKVNCNSMYGAMGAKKGYLPFRPGAKCTTFKGRVCIEKAANWLINNYSVKLIYGDSVTATTPVYVRVNGVFNICTVADLVLLYGDGQWTPCLDEHKHTKEVYEWPADLAIETWTERGWTRLDRVIRHRLGPNKKVFRVITPTGWVEVTDDHSLLDLQAEKLATRNVVVGTPLLHHPCRFFSPFDDGTKNPDEARILGFFLASGSCQVANPDQNEKTDWILVHRQFATLLAYRARCQHVYPSVEWTIHQDLQPLGVYLLGPVHPESDWIRLFWQRIHLSNGTQIVPSDILNGSLEIRQAFWDGIQDSTRLKFSSPLVTAQVMWLAESIGVGVTIGHTSALALRVRDDPTPSDQQVRSKEEIHVDPDAFVYDLTTDNHHFAAGVGHLICHNTDSCYISIPSCQSLERVKEMDAISRQIESEVSLQFPKPMQLAWEGQIYAKYLILSKKRYLALKTDLDGNINPKPYIRGVLLKRRDNSKFIRDFYSKLILKTFARTPVHEIIHMCCDELARLFSGAVTPKELAISKKVGAVEDYKIRELADDPKKCKKRLESLDLFDARADLARVRKLLNLYRDRSTRLDLEEHVNTLEYLIVHQYINKALPGQVQLAERMRARGNRVDVGERLLFVVLHIDKGLKSKVSEMMESLDYYLEHSAVLPLNFLYYTELAINPFDEVLALLGQGGLFKRLYKYHEQYHKVVQELHGLFAPRVVLLE